MIRSTLLVFIFFLVTASVKSQCVSVGPYNPTSASNNTSIGTNAWGGLGNIYTSNDSRAAAGALAFGDVTNYLFATGFNFSIPSTAIICGISVTVERSAAGLFQTVHDHSVRLIKEGVVVGNNHAVAGTWPSSDVSGNYGSSSDLWGTTWTPAEINSANFGLAFSADLTGFSFLPIARIDHIQITVHYDNSLPIELLSLTASCHESVALIQWSTASELNNDFFTLERSTNGEDYFFVSKINGANNSNNQLNYFFEDKNPLPGLSYYRLSQTDHNGLTTYFDPVSVRCEGAVMSIYPNPATESATVLLNFSGEGTYSLLVYDPSQKLVQTFSDLQATHVQIIRDNFSSGIYLLVLLQDNQPIAHQRLIWY